jgi:predicted MFS family arabinose efflux permease
LAKLPLPFQRLAWSNLAAQSAEQISLAAVPLVAVLVLGAGAGENGMLAMVQTLPFLLLSIPLGLVADRASRRNLMIGAEVLRALALLGLLITAWTGNVSLIILGVLGFIGATGTVGFSVAAPSLVPSLVPRESLGAANGQLELARSVAYAAGPALAGALVSWSGASTAFVLATILFAVLLLLNIQEPTRTPALARHPWVEIREGASQVWGHPLLRAMFLTSIAWNLAWFVLQAAYVPYAVRALGLSGGVVGITLATYGAGMIIGSLLAPQVIKRVPFGVAVMVGPFFSVLGSVAMLTSLLVPGPLLAVVSFFLFGIGPIVWTITSTTLRQTVTPNAMLGRVSAIFLTANFGARPIGAAIGAVIGASFGEAACLWLSLAGFLVQAFIITFSPIRTLKTLPVSAN